MKIDQRMLHDKLGPYSIRWPEISYLKLCEYLEQRGVDHQALVKVLRRAGGELVDGGGALLDLKDVLCPPEHSETLVHVLTPSSDPGDHLDIASLLIVTLLHHLETLHSGSV